MLDAPVWNLDHPTYGPLARALTSMGASWTMLAFPSPHGLRGENPGRYDKAWRDNMRAALSEASKALDALEGR
jgi:hypothetical protein